MTTHVRAVRAGDLDAEHIVLAGWDAESRANIAKCKEGIAYYIDPKRDNDPRFHRMVMAKIATLYENQEEYNSKNVFRDALKLAIGWVEEESISDACPECGAALVRFVTKPLKFAECSQEEREEFYTLLEPYYGEKIGL